MEDFSIFACLVSFLDKNTSDIHVLLAIMVRVPLLNLSIIMPVLLSQLYIFSSCVAEAAATGTATCLMHRNLLEPQVFYQSLLIHSSSGL